MRKRLTTCGQKAAGLTALVEGTLLGVAYATTLGRLACYATLRAHRLPVSGGYYYPPPTPPRIRCTNSGGGLSFILCLIVIIKKKPGGLHPPGTPGAIRPPLFAGYSHGGVPPSPPSAAVLEASCAF